MRLCKQWKDLDTSRRGAAQALCIRKGFALDGYSILPSPKDNNNNDKTAKVISA